MSVVKDDDCLKFHPLVYGWRRGGREIVYEPDPSDRSVHDLFRRCPNCEQWSPCDVRNEIMRQNSA